MVKLGSKMAIDLVEVINPLLCIFLVCLNSFTGRLLGLLLWE